MTEYLPSDGRKDRPVTPSVEQSWAPAMRAVCNLAGVPTGYGVTVDTLSSMHDGRLQRMVDALATALTLAEQAQAERAGGDAGPRFDVG